MISFSCRHMLWLHDCLRLYGDCNDDEFCIFKKQIQKTHFSFFVCNGQCKCGTKCIYFVFVTLEDFMSVAEQFLTYNKKQCFLSHGENYQAKDEQHCNWTTRGKKKGNYINQHLAQLRWSFWFLLVKLSWRRRTDASNYGTCCDRVKWFMRFLDKEELLTANRINQCYLKQRKKKQTPLVW